MYKTEISRTQLLKILHAATGNVKAFVMDEDGFLDEQLRLHNVIVPLFCDHNEGKGYVKDMISGREFCSWCNETKQNNAL